MIIKDIAKAIEQSGKTRYRIAVDCGIDHAVIHRIVHGGSCSVETLDKLCEYLGLELRPVKGRRKAKKKGK
jgi:Cro/C1-type HTH DNA-binding domain